MSNEAYLLEPRVRAVAAAIANARGARRGAPAVGNVLDVLPPEIFAALVDDARAAVEAADAAGHEEILARPVAHLVASYVEAIRLDLNAGSLLLLVRDRSSRASGAYTAVSASTTMLGHDAAQSLWRAVVGAVRSEAEAAAAEPSPSESEHQEPTP